MKLRIITLTLLAAYLFNSISLNVASQMLDIYWTVYHGLSLYISLKNSELCTCLDSKLHVQVHLEKLSILQSDESC
jgi:hypothetical protein